MNNILMISILVLSAFSIKAQDRNTFIEGKMQNIYQGQIFLVPNSINDEYYGGINVLDSSKIENGIFKFKRKLNITEPIACRLIVRNKSMSLPTGIILLSSNDKKIEIDFLDEFISPKVLNSVYQEELRNEYCPYFKKIINESQNLFNNQDSLYAIYGRKMPEEIVQKFQQDENRLGAKSDSTFFAYAVNHSNSYVTLWKLIERFEDFGYKNLYYDIFNRLSPSIKSSSTSKAFHKKLELAKLLCNGSEFPKIKLKNLSKEDTFLSVKNLKSEYTLIDFWFVGCSPCLKQFPSFKKIFYAYSRTGFDIVGVSIDKEADLNKLQTFISEKKLSWSNLLDEGGVVSSNLGVNSFPTNFLINQKGVIIRKNISPIELDLFLKSVIEISNIHDDSEFNVPK